MKKRFINIIMPLLVIVLGLLLLGLLGQLGIYVGGLCIVLGIVMLIERKWPEKWKNEE